MQYLPRLDPISNCDPFAAISSTGPAYKRLHIDSQSQDCPVCKAMIEDQKLVPLSGCGKNSSDLRLKSIPGVSIPSRPAGQGRTTGPPSQTIYYGPHSFGPWPATAPPRETIYYGPHSFGPGHGPTTSAKFGNFTFMAAFGDLIRSLFNLQVHEYPDATLYRPGPMTGLPYEYSYPYHGGHALGFLQHGDFFWKMVFLLVGLFIILAQIWN